MVAGIDPERCQELAQVEGRPVPQRIFPDLPHRDHHGGEQHSDDGEVERNGQGPFHEDAGDDGGNDRAQHRHQSHEAGGRAPLLVGDQVGNQAAIRRAAEVVGELQEPEGGGEQRQRRRIAERQQREGVEERARNDERSPAP